MAVGNANPVGGKLMYGWLERPSAASGIVSTFDFLGVVKWFHGERRFRPDGDRRALRSDYTIVADDLRRVYYRSLLDEGLKPEQESASDAREQQTSLFDGSAFSTTK